MSFINPWIRMLIVFCLICPYYLFSQTNPKTSSEKAYQICTEHLKEIGLNPCNVLIRISPNPLTIDSMQNDFLFKQMDSVEFKQAKDYLNNKIFWKCNCKIIGSLGGVCVIFVDSESNKVLYMIDIDANAPIKWSPDKEEKQWKEFEKLFVPNKDSAIDH